MVAIWLWDRSVRRVCRLNFSKCILRFVCLAFTRGVSSNEDYVKEAAAGTHSFFLQASRLDVVPVSSSFGCAKACRGINWLHGASCFISARQPSLSTGSLEAIEVVASPLPFRPVGWNCAFAVWFTTCCGFLRWQNSVSFLENSSRRVAVSAWAWCSIVSTDYRVSTQQGKQAGMYLGCCLHPCDVSSVGAPHLLFLQSQISHSKQAAGASTWSKQGGITAAM